MWRGLIGFVQVPLLVLATMPGSPGTTVGSTCRRRPDLSHQDTLLAQSTLHPLPRFQDLPEILRHPCTRHPHKLVNRGIGRVGSRLIQPAATGTGDRGERYPTVYAGYPWLAYGYGIPLGYSMPYAGDANDTEGPSPMPQQQADEASVDYGTEPPGPQGAAWWCTIVPATVPRAVSRVRFRHHPKPPRCMPSPLQF